MLSKRIQTIEESGIRKIFELASKNKGEYVNLSIGQPHFPTPEELKLAAKNAIDNNCNAYTPTKGLFDLRKKIAKKLKDKNYIKAEVDNIIVTSGVSGAIFLTLSAILDPKDEIILPDPYFVLYKQVVNFLEAKPVLLDTYPDFHISPKKLQTLITSKTKAIIVNSPNNPTGAVYSKEELEEIAKIAKVSNLLIISDEIYENFDYENKFFSVGSIYDQTVTLNGFSKSHSITGWRVGYAHGPKEIIEAMNKLQQYTFVCAPSFAQNSLAKEEDVNLYKEFEKYKIKKDYVYKNLKDKYELNIPEGAFYAFIKIPKNIDEFINKCIENKLLVVPGNAFSRRDDYFRISFAVDDDTLEKGVKILNEII